jgi:hypothetical protein
MQALPLTYSPFERRFDQLDASDLVLLKDVAEGWYVDYKRAVSTKPDATAKIVSAFANTYGGWIFYGVDAPGSGAPTPSAFPGIALADVSGVVEAIQRASAAHLSSAPFFETRTLTGPDADTALPAGRAVVVVRVPPGANSPYVHSSGRIYRRVGDSSEPKAETDRHVLDLLWERSRSARSHWAKVVERDFQLSSGEAKTPVAHVFLSCDPYRDRGALMRLELADFVTVMRDGSSASGGLPFDNFFPSQDGFVARQVVGNDPDGLVLTWRQHRNTTAAVSFPIPYGQFDADDQDFTTHFEGYAESRRMDVILRAASFQRGRVLDVNVLPYLLNGILQRYRVLLNTAARSDHFFVNIRVDSVWRVIPFLDLAQHTQFIEKHGVPVVQESTVFAPPGLAPGITLAQARRETSPTDDHDRLLDTMIVLQFVAAALGLPLPVEQFVADLQPLLERTKQVQNFRTRRGRVSR